MEWHAPAPWMRDTVGAIRAVWRCWQTGEPLRFESEHYDLSLMVPLFDPGPIEHPDIPIHVAAIGPNMCAVAGEVADGVRLHPICTTRFIDESIKPAVERGAAAAGRDLSAIEFCMKPLVATAPDEASLARVKEIVRERVAFYLSTPAYRRVFDLHEWGEQAERAATLSKAHRWDELSALVDDEMLDHDRDGRNARHDRRSTPRAVPHAGRPDRVLDPGRRHRRRRHAPPLLASSAPTEGERSGSTDRGERQYYGLITVTP